MQVTHVLKLIFSPGFTLSQSNLKSILDEKVLQEVLNQTSVRAFYDADFKSKKEKKDKSADEPQKFKCEKEFLELLEVHDIGFPAREIPKALHVYEQLLPVLQLAAHLDNANLVKVKLMTAKLAILFGDVEQVLRYLTRFQKMFPNMTIEDATRFVLPKNDVSNDWDLVNIWRPKAIKDMPDPRFEKVLPFASGIQAYVKENRGNLLKDLKAQIEHQWQAKLSCAFDQAFNKEGWGLKKDAETNKLKCDDIAKKLQENKSLIANEFKTKSLKILSKDTDYSVLSDYVAHALYQYSKDNPKAQTAAETFFTYDLPKPIFDQYLDLVPSDNSEYIPEIGLNDAIQAPAYPGLYIVKLDSADPRTAILGKITGSCQSLGGVGSYYAIDSITQATVGCYILCRTRRNKAPNPKEDEIVAESLVWRSKDGNLVMDSIESQTVFRRDHEDAIVNLFSLLAHKLTLEKGIPRVLVGIEGLTPKEMGSLSPLHSEKPIHHLMKTDAKCQRIVADNRVPFYEIDLRNRSENAKNIKDLKDVKEGKDVKNLINMMSLSARKPVPKEQLEKKLIDYIVICINNKKSFDDVRKHIDLFISNELSIKQRDQILQTQYQILIDYMNKWESGNEKEIQEFFSKNKVDLNTPIISQSGNYKPIEMAIILGNIPLIIYFSEQGAQLIFQGPRDTILEALLKILLVSGDPNHANYSNICRLIEICAKQKESSKLLSALLFRMLERDKYNNNPRPQEAFIAFIVGQGVDVNFEDLYLSTPLTSAVSNGEKNIVKLFLTKGASARNKGLALIVAIDDDKKELRDLLWQSQPDLNTQNFHGDSPLTTAIKKGQTDLVNSILNEKISAENLGIALAVAAHSNHSHYVKLILEKSPKMDLRHTDSNSTTALISAARHNNIEAVDMLLKHKADSHIIDNHDTTALSAAAGAGNMKMVKYFIEDATAMELAKALTNASMNCYGAIVKLLLQYKADVNLDSSLVKMLSEPNVNRQSTEQSTAIFSELIAHSNSAVLGRSLATAIDHNVDKKWIEILIQKKANINALTRMRRDENDTALSITVVSNDIPLRNRLMSFTPNSDNMGLALIREYQSQFGWERRNNDMIFVDELIRRGANINLKYMNSLGEEKTFKHLILEQESPNPWFELALKYNLLSNEDLLKYREFLQASLHWNTEADKLNRLTYLDQIISTRKNREANLAAMIEKETKETQATALQVKADKTAANPITYSQSAGKLLAKKEMPAVPTVAPTPAIAPAAGTAPAHVQ